MSSKSRDRTCEWCILPQRTMREYLIDEGQDLGFKPVPDLKCIQLFPADQR
jgi:hypothetical protein